MASTLTLSPWQAALYEPCVSAFLAGRLGHAQLVLGQSYLGKAVFAEALAQRLLCQRRDGASDACGQCVSCQRLAQGSHGDFRRIGIELNEKTGKLKTAIAVEQIRALSEWLSLTAQLSGPRVVIIETAHRMNTQAANALLKTLEEPMPGRFLLLLSDQPALLPATVRSRCQRLQMALPERSIALAWLQNNGIAKTDAETVLELASGNPGLAAHWQTSGALAVHKSVHADLAACAKQKESAVVISRQWLEGEQSDLRLQFAASIGLGLFRKRAMMVSDAGQSAQSAIKVQEWIDAVNRLRLSLSQPLRHDLALAALLVAWQQLFPEPR